MLCNLGQHVITHFLFLYWLLFTQNQSLKTFYMVLSFTDLGIPLYGLLCPGLLQYSTLVPSSGHSLLPGYNIPLFLPSFPRHIPQRSKCQLDQAGTYQPCHCLHPLLSYEGKRARKAAHIKREISQFDRTLGYALILRVAQVLFSYSFLTVTPK